MKPYPDDVDEIIAQWREQEFDSEKLLAMEIFGRLKRLEVLVMRQFAEAYKQQFGLSLWAFDVLATLRRAGEPYCLSPTALFDAMMISSGAMTHRLQQLEQKAYIERVDNPDDKRSLLVRLTESGLVLINKAVEKHIDYENQLLAGISYEEKLITASLLKKIEGQLSLIH